MGVRLKGLECYAQEFEFFLLHGVRGSKEPRNQSLQVDATGYVVAFRRL